MNNKLNKCVRGIYLYTDDFKIYSHFNVTNLPTAVVQTNFDIEAIALWTPTYLIYIDWGSRLLRNIDFATAPSPTLNIQRLKYCDKVKNLGLILNTS